MKIMNYGMNLSAATEKPFPFWSRANGDQLIRIYFFLLSHILNQFDPTPQINK